MPRKLNTGKIIQVKAFALPFLEDRIPPESVQQKPSFRDTLKFYIMTL